VEAIQVVYQVNSNNQEREYQGLLEAMHTYNLKEGLLLFFNMEVSFLPDGAGIKAMPVWKWLLDG
jgi:predicted AAA+ superfamily ATPase